MVKIVNCAKIVIEWIGERGGEFEYKKELLPGSMAVDVRIRADIQIDKDLKQANPIPKASKTIFQPNIEHSIDNLIYSKNNKANKIRALSKLFRNLLFK